MESVSFGVILVVGNLFWGQLPLLPFSVKTEEVAPTLAPAWGPLFSDHPTVAPTLSSQFLSYKYQNFHSSLMKLLQDSFK